MPGTTSVTYGNEELSAHHAHHIARLDRMRDRPYKVTEHIMSVAEKVPNPGVRMIKRWDVERHSRFTRVQSGHEVYNTFAQPTMVPGTQTWGIVVLPVFISRVDEVQNQGGVLNLLKERTETVHTHFRRAFEEVALRGPAASGTWTGVDGWDDFLTLNGADSSTGLLEDAADGGNTLHGIVKTSYPVATHPQFHNFFRDCAGAFATNGLNALYDSTIHNQLFEGNPSAANSKWYWSQAFAQLTKRSLRSLERYDSDGTMDDGARVSHMRYGGIPVELTTLLPNTGASTTTTPGPWSAVRVNWKDGCQFRVVSGYEMKFDPFQDLPTTVGSRVSLGWLWGQFVGHRPATCAVIADAEA